MRIGCSQKGQISVEYLIIIAVALAVLIPGVLFFYSYSQSNIGSSTSARINEIGLKVIATAQTAYGLGNQSWQTVEFTMPTPVSRVYVRGQELVFVYDTSHGTSDSVFFSPINLTSDDAATGNISSATHTGLTRYRITSLGDKVHINDTE